MWLNRTLCSVLEEMRTCYTTYNFSYLLGLIEEAQSMGNRMEAALGDIEDAEALRETLKKLIKEKEELQKEIEKLQTEKGKE